jgi:hypothetical protein
LAGNVSYKNENAKNTKKGMLFLERRKVILVNKENYSHKHSPSAYKRWPKPYKIALLASRTLSLPRENVVIATLPDSKSILN